MRELKSSQEDEQLILFHATSSQVLSCIVAQGKLVPAGETGIKSNGLGLQNSGNQKGIYLAGSANRAEIYYNGAVNATMFAPSIPNIGVLLKLKVDTKNLVADYDDWEGNNIEGYPSWQKSLEDIEQVVHRGSISTDNISSVKFVSIKKSGETLQYAKLKVLQHQKLFSETLNFGKEMSIGEANEAINKLNIRIQNIGLKTAVEKLDMDKVDFYLKNGAIPDKETELLIIQNRALKEQLISNYRNRKASIQSCKNNNLKNFYNVVL
jgi:hypothetical protein